ncbi:MAG: tetratricopeptide repeat protein [Candidatus Hydrothermales bacterium]
MNISELKKRARECEIKGEYRKALEIYEIVLKQEPEDPEVLFRIGQILIKFNQEKKAGEFLLKAYENFEKKKIYDNRTIALLKKLIQLYPEKKDLYKKIAEAYYNIGMQGEAGKNLEYYIEYLFKSGEYEKGFENYELLLKWQPENFSLKERVAELYLDFRKNKRSIELYLELLAYFHNRNKHKETEIKNKLSSLGVTEKQIEEYLKSDSSFKESESVFVTLDELLSGEIKRFTKTTRPLRDKKELFEEKVTKNEKSIVEMEEEIQKEVEKEFIEEPTFMEQEKEETVSEEKITETEIRTPDKVKTLAETLLIMGDYTGALDTFYKAYELYYKENLMIDALNILKEISEKWPEEIKARKEMVKISHMLKNKELLVDSVLSLGECLYKRGAREDALKWFLKVLEIEPENKKAIEFVTMINPEKLEKRVKPEIKERKQEMKEIKKPQISVAENHKRVKVKREEEKKVDLVDLKKEILEELEIEEKKEKDIFSDVRETLHKFSKKVDYRGKLELGIAMREMGLYEEAIENLKEAIKSDETRVLSLELLGEIFMEIKRYNIAIEYFERALSEKNLEKRREISIEYHLGECYEKLGDTLNALVYYKRVYEKDPEILGLKEKIKELETREKGIIDEEKISFL